MNSSPFMVVLLVVLVAIAAGFLYSSNDHLVQENTVAHAALNNTVELVATINAKATQMAKTIANLEAEKADMLAQQATQTAQYGVCASENRNLSSQLNAAQDAARSAQSGKIQAESVVQDQMATITALSIEYQALQARISQPGNQQVWQPTPTPAAKAQEQFQADVSFFPVNVENALLPTLGIGLFGAVVYASYRMLKIEEHPQRTARKYSADVDTVYVKMTRQEASHYARGRSKGS